MEEEVVVDDGDAVDLDDVDEVITIDEGDGEDGMDEEGEGEGYDDDQDDQDDQHNLDNPLDLDSSDVTARYHHGSPVYAVDISPFNSDLVASGAGDDRLVLWKAQTGQAIAAFAHKDSVVAVKFSPKGLGELARPYLAAGSMDGQVSVYGGGGGGRVNDDDDGHGRWHLTAQMEGPDEVLWLDWHPKGLVLLAGSNDGTLWMWRCPQGSTMQVFSGHLAPVTDGRFLPDGKKVVSVSEDGTLAVWDPQTGARLLKTEARDQRIGMLDGGMTTLAVNEAGTVAVVGGRNGEARMITIALDAANPGQVVNALSAHTDSVECVAVCQQHDLFIVATGSVDGRVCLWDGTTGRLRGECLHDDCVTSILFFDKTTSFLTASLDGKLRIWDARNGTLTRTFSGHTDGILTLARSDRIIVSGSDDGSALVFAI